MQGVTTQFYAPKSSNTCITALKNNPNAQGVAPSLLRMTDILLHTVLSRAKFLTTTVQSYIVH